MNHLRESMSFKGRTDRTNYIIFNVLYFLCLTAIGVVLASYNIVIFNEDNSIELLSSGSNYTIILLCIFACVLIIPINIRRLHDINLSGWWYLLTFPLNLSIPALKFTNLEINNETLEAIDTIFQKLSIAVSLIVMFWPGTKGENKYGPQPE